MPVTISGDGGISGLGGLDGYDLQTQTLVVSGDTTIAPQAAGRASLFVDDSANSVGINTTTPNSSVFLEVADGTDPVVRVNNTGGGNLDIGSTTTFGYVQGSSGHELRLGSNGSNTIVLQGDGDVNIDSNTLYIDISSNRVGIRNNNPASTLHVSSPDGTGVRINSTATQATNTNKALTILNDTTTTATISYRGLIYTADRVGIQTESPQFPLHVNALGRNDAACIGSDQSGRTTLSFRDSTTTNDPQIGSAGNNWIVRTGFVERIRVDTVGRLLIGTDTAHTIGTTVPQVQLSSAGSTGASGTTFSVTAYNQAVSDPSCLILAKSLTSTQGGQGAVTDDNNIGNLRFMVSNGVDFRDAANIEAYADGNWSTASCPGRIVLYTTEAGNTSSSERVRIDNAGSVTLGPLLEEVLDVGLEEIFYLLSSANGLRVDPLIGGSNTGVVRNVFNNLATAGNGGTAYTLNEYRAFDCAGAALNADCTLNTAYGYFVDSNFIRATNNYAFFAGVNADTGRWNFYANGTASNYFAGTALFGTTVEITPGTSNANGVEINSFIKAIRINRDAGPGIVLGRTGSDGNVADFYRANDAVGSISVTATACSFNTSSDYRLKENITSITGATDRVKALKPCRFNFITDTTKTVDGFLAHEAQEVVPEAVTGKKDGEKMQTIDTSKLVPLLTAALQESIARIDELQKEVNALKSNQVN